MKRLAMPPAGTPLPQNARAQDTNGNGSIEAAEAQGNIKTQFALYDANRDNALSGAEVTRGPLAFVRPPDLTYTGPITITLGGKRVEVLPRPIAHADDNTIVRFVDGTNVLFASDWITSGRVPFGGDVATKDELAIVKTVEGLDFDHFVCSHGRAGQEGRRRRPTSVSRGAARCRGEGGGGRADARAGAGQRDDGRLQGAGSSTSSSGPRTWRAPIARCRRASRLHCRTAYETSCRISSRGDSCHRHRGVGAAERADAGRRARWRLAHHQSHPCGGPLLAAEADHHRQRGLAQGGVDVSTRRRSVVRPAGCQRRDVRLERRPRGRARCRHRQGDLGSRAAARGSCSRAAPPADAQGPAAPGWRWPWPRRPAARTNGLGARCRLLARRRHAAGAHPVHERQQTDRGGRRHGRARRRVRHDGRGDRWRAVRRHADHLSQCRHHRRRHR